LRRSYGSIEAITIMVRDSTGTDGVENASDVTSEAIEMAAAAGLVYVTDAQPGIRRATRIRVGNAEYAKANGSYGLTTLRNRHVRFVRAARLLFRFRGKGGAEHEVVVDDERLARIVRRCQHLPGQRLFQYIDDAGQRRGIDSDQVNQYLRDAMGADFTAKDFRTWGATVRASARSTPASSPS
jgi:DNA topoisomerase IB